MMVVVDWTVEKNGKVINIAWRKAPLAAKARRALRTRERHCARAWRACGYPSDCACGVRTVRADGMDHLMVRHGTLRAWKILIPYSANLPRYMPSPAPITSLATYDYPRQFTQFYARAGHTFYTYTLYIHT